MTSRKTRTFDPYSKGLPDSSYFCFQYFKTASKTPARYLSPSNNLKEHLHHAQTIPPKSFKTEVMRNKIRS